MIFNENQKLVNKLRFKNINEYDVIYDSYSNCSDVRMFINRDLSTDDYSVLPREDVILYRMVRSKYALDSFITRPQLLMLLLLHMKTITLKQLTFLNICEFSTAQTRMSMLRSLLARLCKNNVDNEAQINSNFIGNKTREKFYTLTYTGFVAAYSLLPDAYLDAQSISIDYHAYSLSSTNGAHDIYKNDPYYVLLGDTTADHFRWYDSPVLSYGTPIYDNLNKTFKKATTTSLRPDGLVADLEKEDHFIFIEQDMLTERQSVLYEKFLAYANYFNEEIKSSSLPGRTILFNMSTEKRPSPQKRAINYKDKYYDVLSILSSVSLSIGSTELEALRNAFIKLQQQVSSNKERFLAARYTECIDTIDYAIKDKANDLDSLKKSLTKRYRNQQALQETKKTNLNTIQYAKRQNNLINIFTGGKDKHPLYQLFMSGLSFCCSNSSTIGNTLKYTLLDTYSWINTEFRALLNKFMMFPLIEEPCKPITWIVNQHQYTFPHCLDDKRCVFGPIVIENISDDISGYLRCKDFCENYVEDKTPRSFIFLVSSIVDAINFAKETNCISMFCDETVPLRAKGSVKIGFYCYGSDDIKEIFVLDGKNNVVTSIK